ncbi:OmpA family protein [Flavobacterium piscis]|uniref:Outer membrane protein OmpA-like peptidoglycan-associated protein n=1 Tax=Flavobacterium piscis TaxID=1114874 RepID=A0ABU1YBR6_9FLAO|nr:OmpA family protein [Flavobacterium piscis]MDR7211688.1 outer membrane protein OmpA-like peptidoglycan-associated protein [Flavobacterium piscis]
MTKFFYTFLFITIVSCKSENNKENPADINPTNIEKIETNSNSEISGLDINSIPISSKNIDNIIFFDLPKGYVFDQPKNISDYDQFAFFVSTDEYILKEGELFQSRVSTIDNKTFSFLELLRNLESIIIDQLEGKKIFEGKLNSEKVNDLREKVQMYNYPGYGFLGYTDSYVYLIKNKDKENWIHVAKTDDNMSIGLAVLQTKTLDITAKIKTAKEIENELINNGKTVLYINFETNKSVLSREGEEAVNQIAQTLHNNSSLKISIEGHTDNNGSKEYNQELSENRAKSVKNELMSKNISKDRLESIGFGQAKPLVENNNEENKAKNRRVELIRIK